MTTAMYLTHTKLFNNYYTKTYINKGVVSQCEYLKKIKKRFILIL